MAPLLSPEPVSVQFSEHQRPSISYVRSSQRLYRMVALTLVLAAGCSTLRKHMVHVALAIHRAPGTWLACRLTTLLPLLALHHAAPKAADLYAGCRKAVQMWARYCWPPCSNAGHSLELAGQCCSGHHYCSGHLHCSCRAAFKTIAPSTVAGQLSAPVSPGLPASSQTVTYSLQYDSADFDSAEAECQKGCAHLATFISLREQVGLQGWGRGAAAQCVRTLGTCRQRAC